MALTRAFACMRSAGLVTDSLNVAEPKWDGKERSFLLVALARHSDFASQYP